MSGVRHQAAICTLALVVALLDAAPLELQRRLIDDAIGKGNRGLLLLLGGAYLAIILVRVALKFCMQLYQGWLSESAIRYTREHLSRLQRGRANAGDGDDGGRAVAIIGAEVEKLGGFVGEGLSEPVANVSVLVAVLGYMLTVEPLVALLSLAFILPQMIILPVMQHRINRQLETRVSLLRDMGQEVTSLSHGDDAETEAVGLDRIFLNRMRIYMLKVLLRSLLNLSQGLAPLCVMVIGGIFVMNGLTTIGVVVAFMSGFERLSDPLRQLSTYYRAAAQATVQHRMIARWM